MFSALDPRDFWMPTSSIYCHPFSELLVERKKALTMASLSDLRVDVSVVDNPFSAARRHRSSYPSYDILSAEEN